MAIPLRMQPLRTSHILSITRLADAAIPVSIRTQQIQAFQVRSGAAVHIHPFTIRLDAFTVPPILRHPMLYAPVPCGPRSPVLSFDVDRSPLGSKAAVPFDRGGLHSSRFLSGPSNAPQCRHSYPPAFASPPFPSCDLQPLVSSRPQASPILRSPLPRFFSPATESQPVLPVAAPPLPSIAIDAYRILSTAAVLLLTSPNTDLSYPSRCSHSRRHLTHRLLAHPSRPIQSRPCRILTPPLPPVHSTHVAVATLRLLCRHSVSFPSTSRPPISNAATPPLNVAAPRHSLSFTAAAVPAPTPLFHCTRHLRGRSFRPRASTYPHPSYTAFPSSFISSHSDSPPIQPFHPSRRRQARTRAPCQWSPTSTAR